MSQDHFNHQKIEAKWQKYWQENKTFKAEKGVKPKFYALDMFPYPSGAGLHVGHPEGYTASDILARKRRMEGYEVLHPMGWDAFGLPAENYAIKTGTHPRVTTEKNIETFTAQIKALGFSYDWDREINTTDPEYFKWTQWIFLKLFNSYFDQEENKAKPIGELERSFAIGTKNADFNKKRGVAPRRGVAHSGNKARPSLVLTILAEKISNVNAKKNPKKSLRKLFKKVKIKDKTIIFDGLALANHFKKTKSLREYRYRNKWRTTVIKALGKLFFINDQIAYFKVKNNVFRVVLRKIKDQEYIIKTYYRVKTFSEILKITQENANYYNSLSVKEQNEILANYRLAYEKEAPINFCPSCKTGLANEEVVDGKCERCGEEVTRKNLRQWILRITEYAERLLADLKSIKVLIIHGFEGSPEGGWKPGLKKDLEQLGFEVRVPSLPNSAHPNFDQVIQFLENETKDFTENDVIIGHSLGALYALKLAEKRKLKAVFAVAPATHALEFAQLRSKWPESDLDALESNIVDNPIDFSQIKAEVKVAFFSSDDEAIPLENKGHFPADWQVQVLENKGHITDPKFPEIKPFFRDLAQNILDWPTKIKLMQENWIGRSEGAEVDFELVEEFDYKIPSEEEFAKVKAICEKEDLSSYQLRKEDFLIALKDGEMEGFGRILKINDLREISSVWLSEKYRGCKLGQKIVLKLIEKSAGKEFYLNCYQKIKNYYAEVDFEEIAEPKEEQLEKIKYYYEKKRKEKFDLAKVKEEMAFMVHRKCTDFRYSKYPCTHSAKIRVFTTRPDTLFGATYFVLAPEHPLVNKITTGKQKVAVEKYIEEAAKKSDLQRTDLAKEKSGVFTGGYVINPVNAEKIPVWIADYVLMSYGTGAIMAVPAHDERDAEFAKQFDLPIKEVVKNPKNEETECFSGEGIAINSEFLNGLKTKEAKQKMIEYLEEEGLGKRQINYKLRDWIFSRQRYWGEPIPVVHCENCGTVNGVADFARYEYETDNKKGRDTRRGPIVPAGGSTQVCQVNLPLVPRIIASIAYNCKNKFKKTRNRNNRKAVRDIFNKVRNIKKIDSKSLGEINVNWTFLWRHFQKKSFMEFQIRAKLALVVMEVLKKDDFCVESKQEKNCFIFYGRAENNIFTIIVGKRNGEYYLKTFYQSTKLTKTWKDLKSKIGTLPLTLPEVEKFEPSGTGESPLANIDEWVKTTCPKCNEPAKRETNTMPQWAGSSWYWLRFMDPHNLNEFCSKENEKYWGPVDLYVGGAEHAVLHLLYSRFWHKVLYDLGYVSTIEPFKSLKNQGMILAEDGEKMSKSKGNVINPDDIVKEFGADTLRVYEMFMGPFEQAKAWNTNAVEGIYKFLQRVWRLFEKQFDTIREDGTCKTGMQDDVRRLTHKTVKKVSEDIEAFKFNTAISAMMVFVNEAGKWEKLPKKTMEKFIKILAPFAPHLAEEIWHEKLGNKATIAYAAWPEWNEDLAKDEEINLAIQVNGKLRATISVSADIAKEEALKMAKENANVQKWLEGKTLVKEIFVPGKIVNLVVK